MKQSHPARGRRIARATVSAAAIALALSPFGALGIASAELKEPEFAACLGRDMPTDYCCEHAGGVMRKGACIDPDELLQPVGRPSAGVQQVDPVPPNKFRPTRVPATNPVLVAVS